MGMNLQNHLIQDDSRIWSNSGLFEDTSIWGNLHIYGNMRR
jgi:hypothetical protein